LLSVMVTWDASQWFCSSSIGGRVLRAESNMFFVPACVCINKYYRVDHRLYDTSLYFARVV
jgi:putative effector of murein hydrolase LrgA (UPF0299 family)